MRFVIKSKNPKKPFFKGSGILYKMWPLNDFFLIYRNKENFEHSIFSIIEQKYVQWDIENSVLILAGDV